MIKIREEGVMEEYLKEIELEEKKEAVGEKVGCSALPLGQRLAGWMKINSGSDDNNMPAKCARKISLN